MKESRLEHCLKLAVKGNGSVLKGSTECAVSEKQKDSAQKETLVVSVTRKINVEQQRAHSLLPRTGIPSSMAPILVHSKDLTKKPPFPLSPFAESADPLVRTLAAFARTLAPNVSRLMVFLQHSHTVGHLDSMARDRHVDDVDFLIIL